MQTCVLERHDHGEGMLKNSKICNKPNSWFRISLYVTAQLHFLFLRIQWKNHIVWFLNENWPMQHAVICVTWNKNVTGIVQYLNITNIKKSLKERCIWYIIHPKNDHATTLLLGKEVKRFILQSYNLLYCCLFTDCWTFTKGITNITSRKI